MTFKVKLRAGTPDDDNRTYLPEAIKGSDIVVNENGNNSQPYPERLKECHGVIADGLMDTWYEYVPANYDPAKKVPLVIGNHGGLMTGWGHAIYTSWTLVADREGFIVVFPDAHSLRMWAVKGVFDNFDPATAPDLPIQTVPNNMKDNHDMNYLLGLIELMKTKYSIDEGRIFMQGMSMGNLMTSQFARYYGNILAGAAGSGGPTRPDMLFNKDGSIKNEAGHLAVWQSRPEKNGTPPGKQYSEFVVNKYNRFYWMKINECDPIPQISIVGENNFAFYHGKKADLVYLDIKNRDHGQTLDEAFLYWDYLFSGTRRETDGTITHTDTLIPRTGDKFAIALTDGCNMAWFKNSLVEMGGSAIHWQKLKYHGLDGGQKVRGEYLCVPLSFLCEVFNAKYEPSENTLSTVVTLKDGRVLQFARGSIGCVIDDDLRSMYCEALHRDGKLHVSVEWFCRHLLNLQVSTCNGVVYITDHFVELSTFMADLIKDLLYDKAFPDDFKNLEA
ncbi:MAG: hypothetical protein C0410_00210 [Anaerolinea sp.]|nr:hypothetical protein [Anaerolinea sp.]